MPATLQAPVSGTNILRGVKLLGRFSKNGREYSTHAMREAAPKYRGVRVFLGHNRDEPDHPWDDWVGTVERPYFKDDAIYGDIRLRRTGSRYDELMEAAADFADGFGCSHVADGRATMRGGVEVVEEIREVLSVDLVTVPATANGLYESMQRAERAEADKLLKVAGEFVDIAVAAVERAFEKGGELTRELQQFRNIVQLAERLFPQSDKTMGGEPKQLRAASDAIEQILAEPIDEVSLRNIETYMDDWLELLKSLASGETGIEPVELGDAGGPYSESTLRTFAERLRGVPSRQITQEQSKAFADRLRNPNSR